MAGRVWTADELTALRRGETAIEGRTARAVREKAQRLGLVTQKQPVYTAHGLALLLGCNRRQVDGWRQAGMLRPMRPHSSGPFSRRAVRALLVAHPEVIGPGTDKRWLVELLAGK